MPTTIQFGTDGWRAVIAETYTFDNVRLASQACANYFKQSGKAERGIVIGYDTRFGSDRFARAAAEVLTANGVRVLLSDRFQVVLVEVGFCDRGGPPCDDGGGDAAAGVGGR